MSPRRHRTLPLLLAAAAICSLAAGCGSERPADGTTVASGNGGTAAAPPLPPDAGEELPPGHPPIDGAARAGGEQGLPPGHPPIDLQAGGAGLPSGHAPPGGGNAAGAAPGQGGGELSWSVPQGWVAEPPANSMRRAQYRVPGPGGDAELVVFYFGPGQGGDPQSNAARWAGQFKGPDGAPATSTMKTRTTSVGGREVLFVEARGAYDPGMMAGGSGGPKPGYALLGAVVEGPDANWFFKLTGPERTVEPQRGAFEAMIESVSAAG